MPAQILKGFTFADGTSGTAAQLNALADSATILPGAITEQAQILKGFLDDHDTFLFVRLDGTLRKCQLDAIIDKVPHDGTANIATLRKLGTTATTAAAGNDVRFPARFTGIRQANNAAADTIATPGNLTFAPKALAGGTTINWTQAEVFTDTISAPKTYTQTGGQFGQTITVILKLQGNAITFTGVSLATIGAGTTYAQVVITRTSLGYTGYRINI